MMGSLLRSFALSVNSTGLSRGSATDFEFSRKPNFPNFRSLHQRTPTLPLARRKETNRLLSCMALDIRVDRSFHSPLPNPPPHSLRSLGREFRGQSRRDLQSPTRENFHA